MALAHLGFHMPLNQQAKKGFTVLGGVIGPGHQGETGLLLLNGGREDSV